VRPTVAVVWYGRLPPGADVTARTRRRPPPNHLTGRRASGVSQPADRNRSTKTTHSSHLTPQRIGRIHRSRSVGYGTVFGHRFFGRDSISTRPPHGFFSLAPLTLPRQRSIYPSQLLHSCAHTMTIIIIIIATCIKATVLRTLPPPPLVALPKPNGRRSHHRRRSNDRELGPPLVTPKKGRERRGRRRSTLRCRIG